MLKPVMRIEVESNIFFKFYWFLIRNKKYSGMKNDSKIVYCMYMDRTSLSIENNWTNDNGEVYIIYTNEEMQKDLNMSRPTLIKCKKELIDCGLIIEKRQGLNRPNLIFLFNDTFDSTYEKPLKKSHLNVVDEEIKVEEVKVEETQKSDSTEPDSRRNNVLATNKNSIAEKKEKVKTKVTKKDVEPEIKEIAEMYRDTFKKGISYTKLKPTKRKEIIKNSDEIKKAIEIYKNDKDLKINGGFKEAKNWETFINNYVEIIEKNDSLKINNNNVKSEQKELDFDEAFKEFRI